MVAAKQKQRRVVLIFGEPNQGKSYLASQLATEGFVPISLDEVYIKFVRERYPDFYLPALHGKQPGSGGSR